MKIFSVKDTMTLPIAASLNCSLSIIDVHPWRLQHDAVVKSKHRFCASKRITDLTHDLDAHAHQASSPLVFDTTIITVDTTHLRFGRTELVNHPI